MPFHKGYTPFNKGKRLSEQHKKHLRSAHMDNPNYFGHTGPRPNISKALSEYYQTHEGARTGAVLSDETKDKISKAHIEWNKLHPRPKKPKPEPKLRGRPKKVKPTKPKPKKVKPKSKLKKVKPKPKFKPKTKKKKRTGARRGSDQWKQHMSIACKKYWEQHPRKKKVVEKSDS
ncbi:MAG: NUMOD3 domain-containing DNA-binding protein [Nitrososphaeraceae archaeon]|jgi:hypothetical protein